MSYKEEKKSNRKTAMSIEKQVQLCLQWADKGFKQDSIRLFGLEWNEWESLKIKVRNKQEYFPFLSQILDEKFPINYTYNKLNELQKECDQNIDDENMDAPADSALSTISFFVSQALEQQEPSIIFDYWEGKYFESHTFVMPGTNLLKDLEEINNLNLS